MIPGDFVVSLAGTCPAVVDGTAAAPTTPAAPASKSRRLIRFFIAFTFGYICPTLPGQWMRSRCSTTVVHDAF